MKKILSLVMVGVFSLYSISYAITANEVKASIEDVYENGTSDIKKVYDKYIVLYKDIESKVQTGDYFVVSQFTGVDLTGLKANIDNEYTTLLNEIIAKKYDLSAQVDDAENKLDAGIISTGEYEDLLNDVAAQVSGYKATYESKIDSFDTTLSGYISNFEKDLDSKVELYKTDIEKYKDLESKLEELKNLYEKVKQNKEKLEDIIGVSNEVVNEKAEEIRTAINDYFSGYVVNEFQKYVQQDPNMNYFLSGMEIKKQLVLGYISDKVDGVIKTTINSYFPDVDFTSIESGYNDIISKNLVDEVKNYTDFANSINALSAKLKETNSVLVEYLEKFGTNTDKENILEKLKADVVEAFKVITKIVQDDIKQTFSSRLDFVKVKEEQEQSLVNLASKVYSEGINSDDLQKLEELKTALKGYLDVVVLPSNRQTIESLINAVDQKIIEAKNKEILNKISDLSKQIDSLPIGNDFETINRLRAEIKALELPEDLKIKKDLLLAKLAKKENLDRLFESGAIKYYYQKGDLSKRVSDILMKYYNKYKEEGKLDLFMEKINKAEEKLQILKDNLRADIRSYYIIMIDNGFIDFKTRLKEAGELK